MGFSISAHFLDATKRAPASPLNAMASYTPPLAIPRAPLLEYRHDSRHNSLISLFYASRTGHDGVLLEVLACFVFISASWERRFRLLVHWRADTAIAHYPLISIASASFS